MTFSSRLSALNTIANRTPPQLVVDRSIGESVSRAVVSGVVGLYSLRVANVSNALRYFQLFDRTTVPTNSTVPTISSDPIDANGGLLILDPSHFGEGGLRFTSGIAWGISSTPFVFTAAAATDAIVTLRYR